MTYSFDIFDTCLLRACQPLQVFDILASRLMPERNKSIWFEFAEERVRGERLAIRKCTSTEKEDVTLEEIYSCCNFTGIDDSLPSKSKIMEEEMQAERDVLVPVKSVCDMISTLRMQGQQIVFISDMYLPYFFVKEILTTYGLFQEGDHLYISSCSGKRKSTGNLFKLIHKELDVDYGDWVHYGDNAVADRAVPRKLGIKAKSIVHRSDFYENRLRLQDHTSRLQTADVMAAISKAVRLKESGDIQWDFACELIAPAFVPFVYGILTDAVRRGITDLFFMARDSYVFFEIAKVWQPDFPTLKLHYLYVSRDSLYLPGLPDTSLDSLTRIFQKFDWGGLENMLSRLHMSDWEERMRAILPADVHTSKDRLDFLLRNDAFKSELEQKYQEQRSLAVSYFKKEGLGNGHAAVIDLRGTRRCQMAINEILRSAGLNEALGYYFEVDKNTRHDGDFCSLNFSWRYDLTRRQYAIGPYGLFEQYFCITPFKRTYEYAPSPEGETVPVFENDFQHEEYKKRTAEINVRACREYARLYASILAKTDHWQNSEKACSVLTEFFEYPKRKFLKALKDCIMSDSHVQHNSLLKKSTVWSVLASWGNNEWAYGNLVYNSIIPEFWRLVLKMLFKRKARK